MNKIAKYIFLAALLTFLMTTQLIAGEWSPWFYLSDDIEVKYVQVTKDTWSWAFRNISSKTVTYMKFHYVDAKGSHNDFLPGKLQQNQTVGGWAAFTAVSRPLITIDEIKREPGRGY